MGPIFTKWQQEAEGTTMPVVIKKILEIIFSTESSTEYMCMTELFQLHTN